jgi:UDP-GlcNAc:undecaprenyl-phosphate/decaprenyl-phosphate GlcNAc-1-phosphate transferase
MNAYVTAALALVLSFLTTLGLTPMVRRGAIDFGVLDRPDGHLKLQKEAVPYLGGIAVYLGFIVTLSLITEFDARLLGLILGGTMVAMMGLFDDLKVLTPGLKTLGQLLAAWVMLRSGIYIKLVFLPWYVTLPLSVLWLVGITNAFNLVDVSDGLCSTLGAVAAGGLVLIALAGGDAVVAIAAAALCGSLLGFLRYNDAPASIYLGDTGSLFIGFMLAALTMVVSYTIHHPIAALAPLPLLMVPIAETSLLFIARLKKGLSPFRGSPDHFALRLKRRGWTSHSVVLLAGAVAVSGATVAAMMVVGSEPAAFACAAVFGVGFVALFGWFWTR